MEEDIMTEQLNRQLIKKYNVPAPRYTSYPTVPFWDLENWDIHQWINCIGKRTRDAAGQGLSLYIHLPYCESLCTYCGCNTRITKNHSVETPYITAVLKEWGRYKSLLPHPIHLSELHLGGGTPTFFNPENLKRLISGILDGVSIDRDASFSFEAHPANTTRQHLEVLHNLGFSRLSLGIQDFDPAVQLVINRHQTQEDVWNVLREARDIGYTSINFDLIYGLPLQKLQSVRDTVAAVVQMRPDRISYYSYAHVPWLKPGQRRYTEADLPRDDEKLALYLCGKHLLAEAGYRDIGMDHFALPHDRLYAALQEQTLHRNFMGYTDRYTPLLIGLGVSAISDAWYGFAQNVKDVETYLKLVDQQQLPLLKGHTLSDEDLLLRRVILDIMCKGSASWNPAVPALKDAEARLDTLADDGLIRWEPGRLHVTSRGMSFLRNVCMAFDARLAQHHPAKETFSKAV